MAIDVIRQVGAITRQVSTRERDGRLARVVVAERAYNTDQADLWDALTSADRIPRWFLPISGDLRLGGRYQLEGNAGGEVLACDPPDHFTVSWTMGDIDNPDSWVDITLTPQGDGRTGLRLEHTAFVPDEMWNTYGPGAVGVGWDGGLLGLDQYYTTGASITPENAMEWMMSEEGQAYVRGSSAAWAEAAIAGGADPVAARAAAENTVKFYLGLE